MAYQKSRLPFRRNRLEHKIPKSSEMTSENSELPNLPYKTAAFGGYVTSRQYRYIFRRSNCIFGCADTLK